MADDDSNEDQWLYGDCSNQEASTLTQNGNDKNVNDKIDGIHKQNEVENEKIVEEEKENEKDKDEEDKLDLDSDDSDDDVNVVIGDIKTNTNQQPSLNIKRGNLIQATTDRFKPQQGKFSIDEFEAVGTINGVPAQEFNLDSLEDKPWRKPGADITDYFNYGFNEDTWRAYCERQKRMRVHESGSGLLPLNSRAQTNILNENSKYLGINTARKTLVGGTTTVRKTTIDVIGSGLASRRQDQGENDDSQSAASKSKEQHIQVMTADRREYSRKTDQFNGGVDFDQNVPPPQSSQDENGSFIPGDFAPPEPGDFYVPESDPYYQSFEPTQEQQWGPEPNPGPNWNQPPQMQGMVAPMGHPGAPMLMMPPPNMMPPNMNQSGGGGGGAPNHMMIPPPNMIGGGGPMHSNLRAPPPMLNDQYNSDPIRRDDSSIRRDIKEHSPSREHSHSRSRSDRDSKHRSDRPHRRERSRSRSRRHNRSRSRSPSHRSSHKKKKSKRHDKSDSE